MTCHAGDRRGSTRLDGGPGNSSAGPFPARQIITLAPGQSGTMTFAPPKSLPAGSWRVTVNLVSGITTCTATATIQFGPVVAARTGLSGMAWTGIALVAFFVLALAVVMVRYARQHRTMTA